MSNEKTSTVQSNLELPGMAACSSAFKPQLITSAFKFLLFPFRQQFTPGEGGIFGNRQSIDAQLMIGVQRFYYFRQFGYSQPYVRCSMFFVIYCCPL